MNDSTKCPVRSNTCTRIIDDVGCVTVNLLFAKLNLTFCTAANVFKSVLLSEDFSLEDLPLEEDFALELDFPLLEDDLTLVEDFAELLDCLILDEDLELLLEPASLLDDEDFIELEDSSFLILDEDFAELLVTLLDDVSADELLCCGATTLIVPVTVVLMDSKSSNSIV